MTSHRPKLLIAVAVFIALAFVTSSADAQFINHKVIERYKYLAFVGPQLPRDLADTTGECITECDGTYWCWGYRAPWIENWVEFYFEECPPMYPGMYASTGFLKDSKVFQLNREKYARGAAAMRTAERRITAGTPLRLAGRSCAAGRMASLTAN